MKKINHVFMAMSMMMLSACSVTGLSAAPSIELEEPSNNYTEAELNALLEAPVTRGSTTTYSYAPVRCNASGSYGCTNIDLIEDIDSTPTDNTSSYYLIMNKNGKCLTSGSDHIKTTSCDPASDYQRFRFSYTDADKGQISVDGGEGYYSMYRYHFSIIPRKTNKGTLQSYGSESKRLKKISDQGAIEQDSTSSTGSKYTFYLFDSSAIKSSNTYPISGQTGDYFLIQNEWFAQNGYNGASDRTKCLRQKDGKWKIEQSSSYKCNKSDDKFLWRVMKIIES